MMLDYDTKLWITYGIAVAGTAVAGLWIVRILIEIELNKTFLVEVEDGLELTEGAVSTSPTNHHNSMGRKDMDENSNGPHKVEIEMEPPETENQNRGRWKPKAANVGSEPPSR